MLAGAIFSMVLGFICGICGISLFMTSLFSDNNKEIKNVGMHLMLLALLFFIFSTVFFYIVEDKEDTAQTYICSECGKEIE